MKCSGLTVVSEKARRRCRDFRLRRGLEGKSRGSTTGVPSGTPPRADAGGAAEDAGGAEVVARRREAEDDEGLLRAEGFFDEADIRVAIMVTK